MKIRKQFLISIVAFSILLLIIGASIVVTMQQTAHFDNEETTARNIQTGAATLNYISNNYLLFQENSSIRLWQSEISKLSDQLARISPISLEQQVLVDNVRIDVEHLNTVFVGVVTFLQTAPRNVSIRVLPEFQTAWSRMAVQLQALSFDSQQLSQSIREQINQLNSTNAFLVFGFLAAFGAYFVTNYLIAYRSTLKSISDLQQGIAEVGSGNLDYALRADKKDEFGVIANSLNRMTANLREIKASKKDLEKEIADRKKAEEGLKESERKFKTLAENAPDAIMRFDTNFRVLYLNPQDIAATGIPLEKFIGKTNEEMGMPAHLCKLWNDMFDRAKNTKQNQEVEFDFNTPAGARTFNLRVVPEFDENSTLTSYMGISRDVTDQKKLEKTIVQEKQTLKGIMENTGVMLACLDPNFNFIAVNSAYAEGSGHSKEELIGKNHFELFPDVENQEIFRKVRDTGKPVQFFDKPFEFVDQPERGVSYWHWTLAPIKDSSDRVQGLVVSLMDTTQRVKIQQALGQNQLALIQSQKKYRRLYETSQDGIMARDLEGRMIDCNRAYAKMLGYSKKELRSLSVHQLLPKKWLIQREQIAKEVIETGISKVFEREYIRKDGSIFPASVRSWRLTDEKGTVTGVWSIVRDITEQKKVEEALRKAEWISRQRAEELEKIRGKLEEKAAEVEEYATHMEELAQERLVKLKDADRLAAIGATAGMVGHDIRNPLQSISGDIYLAMKDLIDLPQSEQKQSIKESLESIDKSVDYINKIVQDLQDYARPINPIAKKTELKVLVNELLKKTDIPKNIRVHTRLNANANAIIVDPDLLNRVLYNLVSNAVQAMPEGGKLTISASQKEDDTIITIADTGAGIPENAKPRLFTPLFTTKSKGQGFGLAVVKRMTEALGGTIAFESEIGKGTKFIVRLPPPRNKR